LKKYGGKKSNPYNIAGNSQKNLQDTSNPYNASTLVSSYFTKSYSIHSIGFLSCLRMRCIVIFSIYHDFLQLEYRAKKKKFTINKNTDIGNSSHNRYAMNNAFDLRSARAILGDKK